MISTELYKTIEELAIDIDEFSKNDTYEYMDSVGLDTEDEEGIIKQTIKLIIASPSDLVGYLTEFIEECDIVEEVEEANRLLDRLKEIREAMNR